MGPQGAEVGGGEAAFLRWVAQRTTACGEGGFSLRHPDTVDAIEIASMSVEDLADFSQALAALEAYRSLPASARIR